MNTEADRLERLWSGSFGDEYTHRNNQHFKQRKDFWIRLCTQLKLKRVLEVGCNACGNLKWIDGQAEAFGVDINRKALEVARVAWPSLNLIYAVARDLPFKDGFFDLAFTCGVLIHQPAESLKQVMGEIVRCSNRYVLAMEYYAAQREEIPYRKQEGALFRDDFGGIYQREFKLKLVEAGRLTMEDGFDDVTYWVLMK